MFVTEAVFAPSFPHFPRLHGAEWISMEMYLHLTLTGNVASREAKLERQS
jgi:hypothetical protein